VVRAPGLPLTNDERQVARDWADGKLLGDGWLEVLPRVLESEGYWRARAARMRVARETGEVLEPVGCPTPGACSCPGFGSGGAVS